MKKRRWRSISHILRMGPSAIPRVSVHWTPPRKRARGRARESWRRNAEKEMQVDGISWQELRKRATHRQQCGDLVTVLCANGTKRIKWVSTLPNRFFIIFSIPTERFSLVKRIRNFVHYELPEKSIFQNCCTTALITFFVITSMSAPYFPSVSLERAVSLETHKQTVQ